MLPEYANCERSMVIKMEYDDFLLIVKGAEAEIVEKKSRFIATVRPVASEEEAAAFIEEMKKKYIKKFFLVFN